MIGKNISDRRAVGCRVWMWMSWALLCGAVIAPADATGYLPRLGPSPLAYQAPSSGFVAVLPPLQMQDQPLPSGDDLKNGTNAVAARLAGMNASGTNAPTIPMVKLHDDPPATAPSSTPPPLPPPPAPPVEAPAAPNAISNVMPPGAITPQMLIRFFEGKGDKHRSGGLAVPFLFTPPSPPGPSPSSTATYIKQ